MMQGRNFAHRIAIVIAIIASSALSEKQTIAIPFFSAPSLDSQSVAEISNATSNEIKTNHSYETISPNEIENFIQSNKESLRASANINEYYSNICKKMNANKFILGNIDTINRNYIIKMKLYDVETGSLVSSAGKILKGSFRNIPTESIQEITWELIPREEKYADKNIDADIEKRFKYSGYDEATQQRIRIDSINNHSSALLPLRIITGISAFVLPIIGMNYESAYQDDLDSYRSNNRGSTAGYPQERKSAYRTSRNLMYAVGILNASVFALSFAF